MMEVTVASTVLWFFVVIIGVLFVRTCFELRKDLQAVRQKKNLKNLEAAANTEKVLELESMSYASREILKDLNAIPETNRPNVDLMPVLKALDQKHEVDTTNNHFTFLRDAERIQRPSQFSWSCRCEYKDKYSVRCPYYDYFQIHQELQRVTTELNRQEVALANKRKEEEIAGLEPTLNEIPLIMDRIRAEREIVQQTTKELTA